VGDPVPGDALFLPGMRRITNSWSRFLLVWLLLLGISACAKSGTQAAPSPTIAHAPTLTPTPTEAPAYGPAFTVGACLFEIPKGYNPIFGTLILLENPASRRNAHYV
jgi:hypothetical protein